MKTKIEKKNAAAIESALLAVNGRAHRHAYTEFSEIEKLAQESELLVVGLVGSQKAAIGAVVDSTSGQSVARAYDNTRIGTTVTLERCATGWFLVGVAPATLYQDGGKDRLTLTEEQDATAVALLRSQYIIAKSVGPAVDGKPQFEAKALHVFDLRD